MKDSIKKWKYGTYLIVLVLPHFHPSCSHRPHVIGCPIVIAITIVFHVVVTIIIVVAIVANVVVLPLSLP